MTNSVRNLMAKINRRLTPRGERLHKTRDKWIYDLGQFHVIDERTNHYCGPGRLDTTEDLNSYFLRLCTVAR